MTLNGRQLIALKIGIILMTINIIFPPWVYTVNGGSFHSENPAGYYSIFEPPSPESSKPAHGVKIDLSRLLIQVVAIILISALGMIKAKPGIQKARESKENIRNSEKEKPTVKSGDPWTD
ncbi:MAG: hypothetical protein L3J98_07695 [Gammaproteobacteria bacterium]|nr:hypothetical protein [Gammaproteobacteria bacterium]MCF6260031.1 hypothetical protein [Gammaproteobacteria bacterium]